MQFCTIIHGAVWHFPLPWWSSYQISMHLFTCYWNTFERKKQKEYQLKEIFRLLRAAELHCVALPDDCRPRNEIKNISRCVCCFADSDFSTGKQSSVFTSSSSLLCLHWVPLLLTSNEVTQSNRLQKMPSNIHSDSIHVTIHNDVPALYKDQKKKIYIANYFD